MAAKKYKNFSDIYHQLDSDDNYDGLEFWYNDNGSMAVIIPPQRRTIFYRQKYGSSRKYSKINTPVSIALPWQTWILCPEKPYLPDFIYYRFPLLLHSSSHPAKNKDCIFYSPSFPNTWGDSSLHQTLCLGDDPETKIRQLLYQKGLDGPLKLQNHLKSIIVTTITEFFTGTFNNDVASTNPFRCLDTNFWDRNQLEDLENWLDPKWTVRGVTSDSFLKRNSEWNIKAREALKKLL